MDILKELLPWIILFGVAMFFIIAKFLFDKNKDKNNKNIG